MPYYDKIRGLWIGQIRRGGKKSKKQFQTKAQAKKWEIEFQKLISLEPAEPISIISLFDFASSYLDYAKSKYVTKTYKEKQSAFRSLFRSFPPEKSVAELTKGEVWGHFTTISESRSGNAVNKDRKNLVAAWRWAQIYIESFPEMNPFAVDRFPEKRHPRYVPMIEDFWKVCQQAESVQDKTMLLCYLYLAARRHEIFNLKIDDVDLVRKKIRLYTRKRKDGSLEFDWIPIAEQLLPALQTHLEGLEEKTWVFPNPGTGLPYFERGKWMRRLCKIAEVEPFGLHSIRHLTASILSENNAPLIDIKTILRHKKITTTERYIHQLKSCRSSLSFLPESPQESPLDKKNG